MIFQQGFSKTCLTIRNGDLTNRNGDFMGFNQQKYDKSIWWKPMYGDLMNSPIHQQQIAILLSAASMLVSWEGQMKQTVRQSMQSPLPR